MNDTTSNSKSMTMEERLAQRLKDSELGMLLDEDALGSLSRKALEKAFFTNRTERNPNTGYGQSSTIDKPPLVVELAKEQFEESVKVRLQPLIDELIDTLEFNELVQRAIMAAIPKAAMDQAHRIVYASVTAADEAMTNKLNALVSDKLGTLPIGGVYAPRY